MLRDTMALAATVVLLASAAHADHDLPAQAAKAKVDLVRAYAPCTAPNDVHDQIVVFAQACSPAAPLSPYRFGAGGKGKAQIQRVNTGIKLRFDLRDVRAIDDQPANGVEFSGRLGMRVTDHGCSTAPSCTIETWLQIGVSCSGGRCIGSTLFPVLFLPVGLDGAVEITQVDVLDDAGNRFATAGILMP